MTAEAAHPFPDAKKIQKKIDALRAKEYLPAMLVYIIGQVALLQRTALENIRLGQADSNQLSLPEGITSRIATADAHIQGACLLPREHFSLDTASVKKLATAILKVIISEGNTLAPHAAALKAAFKSKEYTLQDACVAALKDDAAYFFPWERKHPEAPGFLRFIAQSALAPSVMATAQLLAPHHNNTAPWAHGHCPVCGSQPLMGQLVNGDAEGARLHTCSFCSFEYRVPRIGCPFCLNVTPGHAEYYASEEEPGYQIDVCNACKNYIKLADFRQFDRIFIPALDDLESLALDLHARQMGYTRPTLSAWGF